MTEVAEVGVVQPDRQVQRKAAAEASREASEASSEKDRSLEMLMGRRTWLKLCFRHLIAGRVCSRWLAHTVSIPRPSVHGEVGASMVRVVTDQRPQCWIRMPSGFDSVRRKSASMR